jgi:hypothetical protein
MMMIGGCYGFVLPACCVLGWICGWDVVKNCQISLAQLLSQNHPSKALEIGHYV